MVKGSRAGSIRLTVRESLTCCNKWGFFVYISAQSGEREEYRKNDCCREVLFGLLPTYNIIPRGRASIISRRLNMRNEQGCFVCKFTEFLQNLWESIMGGLFQERNTIRISPQDWKDQYLVNKLVAGENVSLAERNDAHNGRQIVITANKSQGRVVQFLNADGVVDPDTYLVIVDASANPVTVVLPVAHDYKGQLSIVCADATNAITLAPNASTQNVIFDTSNIEFHAKGDSLTLVSDGGESEPPPVDGEPTIEADEAKIGVLHPGTWFVVGRYAAVWYA